MSSPKKPSSLFTTVWLLLFMTTGFATAGTISGTVMISGHAVKDAVVSIEGIQVKPSNKRQSPQNSRQIDHLDLNFVPHVLPITAGSTVYFLNSDGMPCNIYAISAVKRFNLGLIPKGEKKSIAFNEPGVVEIFCNNHAKLHAYVLIKENPYFAVSDERGKYTIANIPAGRYTLQIWYEGQIVKSEEITVPQSGAVEVDL